MLHKHDPKVQSAMEYLMTYGWAILAIAIVMVSLYSLGIFNTGSLQPTATPGSCEVVKTVAQTSLAGQCSNLIPKYVGKFNGASSMISFSSSSEASGTNNLTWVVWVKVAGTGSNGNDEDALYGGTFGMSYWTWPCYVEYSRFNANNGSSGPGVLMGSCPSFGIWHQYVGTFNGTHLIAYKDGVLQGTAGPIGLRSLSPNPFYIGTYGTTNTYYLNGSIANVQVYNISLDSASVKALYLEGIGGTPIDVNHLVGWWPLNGNANDYSGNNNQGTPTNVIWNANWQSGYATPTS